jgi:hypothetical protein
VGRCIPAAKTGESSQRFPQSKFAVHGVEIYDTAAASELRKQRDLAVSVVLSYRMRRAQVPEFCAGK